MSDAALRLDKVVRSFFQGGNRIEVLKGVSMSLKRGELVALVGPSGAGKSTLLHVAGLPEPPDGGDIHLDGRPCGGLGGGRRHRPGTRRGGCPSSPSTSGPPHAADRA